MTVSGASTTTTGTAFPYRSVIILALVLTVNGYTLANLFPYVGLFVKRLMGLSTTNESGYYAGYVASSFTFGRFLTAYVWGSAADTIGRKAVIIVGLSTIVACSVAFGLSTSFAMAISTRFVLGLMNGIMPAVRTMTHEICGPEHVVLGMNYVSGSKGIGMVIGTSIGGLLAQPALAYPTAFSATGIFATYPFLLPNLFGATFALLVLPLVYFFLPETRTSNKPSPQVLPGRKHKKTVGRGQPAYQPLRDDVAGEKEQQQQPQESSNGRQGGAVVWKVSKTYGATSSGCAGSPPGIKLTPVGKEGKQMANGYGPLNGNDTRSGDDTPTCNGCTGGGQEVSRPHHSEEGEPGIFEAGGLLSTPNVKMIIFMAFFVQIVVIGFEEVYPLWAVSTPDVGGLGWTPKQIGKVLGATGIILSSLTLGVFPPAIKAVGVVNWQRVGCAVGVLVFLATPNAKFLSWDEGSLFAVSVLSNLTIFYSIGSIMLPLTVASTSIVPQHQRGKLSGLFMTSESLGRFIGPVSSSNVFAWSISPSAPGLVDHRFVFVLFAGIMVAVAAMSWRTFNLETLQKSAGRGGESDGELEGGSAAVAGDGGARSTGRQDEESLAAVGSPQKREQDWGTALAVVV